MFLEYSTTCIYYYILDNFKAFYMKGNEPLVFVFVIES